MTEAGTNFSPDGNRFRTDCCNQLPSHSPILPSSTRTVHCCFLSIMRSTLSAVYNVFPFALAGWWRAICLAAVTPSEPTQRNARDAAHICQCHLCAARTQSYDYGAGEVVRRVSSSWLCTCNCVLNSRLRGDLVAPSFRLMMMLVR